MISGDWAGHVMLFRRQQDGSFASGETLRPDDGTEVQVRSASAAFVDDWNGDGRLDLLVGDVSGSVVVFEGLGKLRFSAQKPVLADGRPLSVPGDAGPVVADWKQDGSADLIVG